MPEPNLPPLHIAMGPIQMGCVNADELKETLPELPEQTRQRLQGEVGLNAEQAIILVVSTNVPLEFVFATDIYCNLRMIFLC